MVASTASSSIFLSLLSTSIFTTLFSLPLNPSPTSTSIKNLATQLSNSLLSDLSSIHRLLPLNPTYRVQLVHQRAPDGCDEPVQSTDGRDRGDGYESSHGGAHEDLPDEHVLVEPHEGQRDGAARSQRFFEEFVSARMDWTAEKRLDLRRRSWKDSRAERRPDRSSSTSPPPEQESDRDEMSWWSIHDWSSEDMEFAMREISEERRQRQGEREEERWDLRRERREERVVSLGSLWKREVEVWRWRRAFMESPKSEELDLMSLDGGKVQKETPKKILEENCDAEYLQDLGLGKRTDLESFKACVPLVTHKNEK